jgi:5'-phosphate synthase pdxT subunit
MIVLASQILDGRPDQVPLGAIDIVVRRNAFGRQVDSFESDLAIAGVDGGPVRAVFIRAPWVERAGPDVQVLARVAEHPVAVRQGRVLATSFHPEVAGDVRRPPAGDVGSSVGQRPCRCPGGKTTTYRGVPGER